ncbi:putative solute-binding protein, partial [Oleiphilus sp. HI0128]
KILFTAVIFLFSTLASALEKKTICTWDPVGKNGPVMTFYSDLKPKAIAWGLDLEFIAYTDEKVAANDFKAGVCDGAHLSAILSRQFVPFAGTLDAIGGITSDSGLGKILATLASPKAGKIMTNGQYEAVAAWPVGSMFAFVNDKNINTVADFSGKKISVLNEDPQTHKLANMAGASPVGTSLATFSGQFNNGNIDILFMPALAYNTFELYHGLGDKGGILDYRLYYGMLQTITKKDNFPADFGNKMRKYVVGRLKAINKLVADAEKEIPAKYWIKTNEETKKELVKFSRDIRLALKAEGKMDPKALKLLWKIRCAENPSASECATPE